MNTKLTVAFALLFLLCFGRAQQALAQARAPGVQAGDHFTYIITAHWSSDYAGATVPNDLLELNSTLWYRVTVSEVSGSNVTTDDVWHFANGTERPAVVVQNVDSGSSYFMTGLIPIFGANLTANDLLHPSGDDLWRVNETESRDYASGKRDTNVVTFSYPIEDSANIAIGTSASYYFDKATGILVERRENSVTSGETVSIILSLKETNLWTVSAAPPLQLPLPMPILIALILFVTAAMVSVMFYGRRKSRRKKRRR